MDCEKLARKAEAARAAVVDLAAASADFPGLRLNLVRSIQLLEELAVRARGGKVRLELFDAGGTLSTAMAAGLKVPSGVLPDLEACVMPAELIEFEIAVRKDVARRTGALGGAQRTAAQAAAFEKARAARAVKAAERKAAKALENAPGA